MKKNKSLVILTWAAVGIISAGLSANVYAGQEEPISQQPLLVSDDGSLVINPPPSAVLAPQGLTPREQAQLEQQYRYSFRNKQSLFGANLSSSTAGAVMESSAVKRETKQEKLYRYFGAAAQFYKNRKYDEAVDILKYIVEQNPDDEYVRNFLGKVERERDKNKKEWTRTMTGDANAMNSRKIKALLSDGIAYYQQKDYDTALVKFSDVLALDPGNAQARSYFDRLKGHFLKEVRIEGLVDKAEALTGDAVLTEEKAADRMLNNKEKEMERIAQELLNDKDAGASRAAERLLDKRQDDAAAKASRLLDDQEMETIVKSKRVSTALDQAEMGLTIENIITNKRKDERKEFLYTLGIGDSIAINVRDHPELSGRAVVGPHGDTVLPLVNDVVMLKDLTSEEAAASIQEALKRYVKDPYVTVNIDGYNSKKFYVIDDLGCTPYPITRGNLTLRDALFIADWGDNKALGRVLVMKPNNLHPIVKKVDAFDIIYRGNLINNVRIGDGDVIYVPLTVAAKVTKTIADSLQPFAAVRSIRDEWINLRGDIKSWKELPKIRNDFEDDAYEDFLWYNSSTATSIGVSN